MGVTEGGILGSRIGSCGGLIDATPKVGNENSRDCQTRHVGRRWPVQSTLHIQLNCTPIAKAPVFQQDLEEVGIS